MKSIKYKKYISDTELYPIWDDIISNKNNVLVESKTGSGKTTALVKGVLRNKQKTFICSPLRTIVEQMAAKYSKDNPDFVIDYVHGGKSNWKHIIRKSDVCFIVYECLPKVVHDLVEVDDILLVIDEYHNLVIQQSFREVDKIINHMDKFLKIIAMTGTPMGIIYKEDDFQVVRFIQHPFKSLHRNINIIKAPPKKEIEMALSLLYQNKNSGKVLFLLNDKKKLETIHILLKQRMESDKILVLHRDNSKDSRYIHFVKSEKLLAEIILCTIFISDGINIQDEIDSIIVVGDLHFTTLLQFLARPRKGTQNVYIVSSSFTETDLELPDIQKIYTKTMNLLKSIPKINSNQNYRIEELPHLSKFVTSSSTANFEIKREILHILNSILYNDTKNLQFMLEKTEKISSQISDFSSEELNHITDNLHAAHVVYEQHEKKIKEEMKTNPEEVISKWIYTKSDNSWEAKLATEIYPNIKKIKCDSLYVLLIDNMEKVIIEYLQLRLIGMKFEEYNYVLNLDAPHAKNLIEIAKHLRIGKGYSSLESYEEILTYYLYNYVKKYHAVIDTKTFFMEINNNELSRLEMINTTPNKGLKILRKMFDVKRSDCNIYKLTELTFSETIETINKKNKHVAA